MRLDALVLRIPGDEFRIRFHEQLTVLGGIGLLERQALAESIISAIAGTADATVLTYTDATGRPVEVVSDPAGASARYLDDGTPAPLPVGSIAGSVDELRALVLLSASDLGLSASRANPIEPELEEARATLAELTEELRGAMAVERELSELRDELETLEAQLRDAEDGAARRVYAGVLAELERVRQEAATSRGGKAAAETDRHLLASADDARELARRWSAAARRVAELRERFGDAERLDPATLGEARNFPAAPPADLDQLLANLEDARTDRDLLHKRLRDRTTATLPEPSDPRIVSLATADQAVLWGARDRVEAANRLLQREQLAVGGPADDGSGGAGAVGSASEITRRIEEAQRGFAVAEARRQRYFVPTIAASALTALLSLLLGAVIPILGLLLLVGSIVGAAAGIGLPWRRVIAAGLGEKKALADAGAETYLGFHLRRVDAAIDRDAQTRVQAAIMEHRAALATWESLAPGIDVAAATALESESRRYAEAFADLGGTAGEIEILRAELTGRAEPALARARTAVLATCSPYGVDAGAIDTADHSLVTRLVQSHVALGERARAQVELERAEEEAGDITVELDDLLRQLGFEDGELEDRVGALDWAVDRAFEREQARITGRPLERIEADIERLEAEAEKMRRPEWSSVRASDAEGPDPAELRARAADLRVRIDRDSDEVIDLERIAERHSAMERRVAALESVNWNGVDESTVSELADLHQHLLAHLTKASHAGPLDEPVPVVLDDVFARIAAERKWELLDMLRRLGEKTQLVYLTDDPFVGAWARRRASAGLVTLLEPADA